MVDPGIGQRGTGTKKFRGRGHMLKPKTDKANLRNEMYMDTPVAENENNPSEGSLVWGGGSRIERDLDSKM